MVERRSKPEKRLLKRLKVAFAGLSQCREIRLNEDYELGASKVSVPYEFLPLQLSLGKGATTLHLCCETSIDGSGDQASASFVLFDPDRYYKEISGFLRLGEGDILDIGRHDEVQNSMFAYPKSVARRHLTIAVGRDGLLFKGLDPESATTLSPLREKKTSNQIRNRRMENLREIRRIYAGPVEPLAPDDALATLEAVNGILEEEVYRQTDTRDCPGGVLNLPKKMVPVIVGDLHARVDNLLTLLSQNEFLEAMNDGKAALIFLGDAVHSEVDGQMEEMDSSMLIMDLILRLKMHFPQQVFYLRGNHDSFSEDVGKDGIPQGLLWKAALKKARGADYRKAMSRFYKLLPYVAVSRGFAACHAAPPVSKVSMDELVNLHRHPKLVEELINNRLHRPGRPGGYTKRDVKRFRKSLKLTANADLFVGHTPLARDETLWLEAGGIEHHHVVFGANTPWVGVFIRCGERMVPLRYRTEHLLPIINGSGEDGTG